MGISNSKVGSTRWELKEFSSKWRNNQNEDIYSEDFSFGSSRFLLFYTPVDLWKNEKFGVMLAELIGKQPLKVNLKLWFENREGHRFQNSVQKHAFSEVGDCCEFNLKLSDADHNPLSKVFKNDGSLFICCKITESNYQATVPIANSTQKFQQNTWLAYEQGLHDAIIKVGETEFKILKSHFMVQSEVFKQMFTLNFKERNTNTVILKDISEKTMKQLIRWMYTCQIEDKSAIEGLFEAADKYQINLLKTRCAELMINSLNNSNVFCRLILAVAHDEHHLKNFALSYIGGMSSVEVTAYLTSSEWTELAQKKSVFVEEVNKLVCDKLKK